MPTTENGVPEAFATGIERSRTLPTAAWPVPIVSSEPDAETLSVDVPSVIVPAPAS